MMTRLILGVVLLQCCSWAQLYNPPSRFLSGTATPSSGTCDSLAELGAIYIQTGNPASVRTQVFVCAQTDTSSYGWMPMYGKVQASAPATCSIGDIWFDSDATAGQNVYGCTASNTWTLQAGGGGGGGLGCATGTSAPTTGAQATCYIRTDTTPRQFWVFVATDTPLLSLLIDPSAPARLTLGSDTAPSTPAADYVVCYAESDAFKCKNDGGVVTLMFTQAAIDAKAEISGTPTNGQCARWTGATAIEGFTCPGGGGGVDYTTTTSQVWDFLNGSPIGGQQIDNWAAVTISGAGTLAWLAAEANHPGIARLNTSTSASSDSLLYQKLANYSDNIILPSSTFSHVMLIRANGTQPDGNSVLRAGLWGQSAQQPTDGLYFEKLTSDPDWFGVCRSGGSETRTSAVASVTNGWIALEVYRFDGSTIRFRAAATLGGLSAATPQSCTTNIPSATLFGNFLLQNNSAAARSMDIDFVQQQVTGMTR